MSRYRVTVAKAPGAARSQTFASRWQAWRYARRMRSCGYQTTTERLGRLT